MTTACELLHQLVSNVLASGDDMRDVFGVWRSKLPVAYKRPDMFANTFGLFLKQTTVHMDQLLTAVLEDALMHKARLNDHINIDSWAAGASQRVLSLAMKRPCVNLCDEDDAFVKVFEKQVKAF
jgi:hypothetical protein